MDLDEFGRRSEELAARLGVPSPDVESGSLPEWCVNGLRLRRKKRQTVVVVGAAFDGLSAAEQEGALAYVVAASGFAAAAADRDNTGLKRVSRIIGFVLGASISLTILLGAVGSSAVLASASVLVLSVFAFGAVIVAWTRRMIYRTDHLVTPLAHFDLPELSARARAVDDAAGEVELFAVLRQEVRGGDEDRAGQAGVGMWPAVDPCGALVSSPNR
ncbi:hypothetical protein [Nocardia tengchongensis]|uniref:hypothetical protein n=1 Tax=Nocardia tengchongensis TaxID=2055889 RepID=UPI00367DFB7D